MNKRMKTKWIKALRSGRYKQGRGRLKTEKGSYCCLGVLNKVCKLGAYENFGSLDLDQLKKVGITPDEQSELIMFNVADRMPFELIAGYIQENL